MSHDPQPQNDGTQAETAAPVCLLCQEDGGELVLSNSLLRVVLPHEPDYPGFVRVILNRHVVEMTDLDVDERDQVMRVVWCIEGVVREVMEPHKVNVASLGNVVAHVHWHIIPRYADDRHFPAPIWAAPTRHICPMDHVRRQTLAGMLPNSLRMALTQEA